MVASTIRQNQIPNEPQLKDLLDLFKKDLLINVNCHHVASIQTFNPVNQTATATVNYKKTVFEPSALEGGYVPVLKDYPVLLDCPVVCIGGGNGALTFPVSAGDECVVMFNDRDIDNWLQGSSASAVATPRLHSFSDGIILVGIRSLANVIPSYSSTHVELRTKDGINKIAIAVDGSSIKAQLGAFASLEITADGKLNISNLAADFVPALVQLFTDIAAATAAGFPLVMPTFAADLALLASFSEGP